MKRIFAIFLAILMCLSTVALASCGGGDNSSENTSKPASDNSAEAKPSNNSKPNVSASNKPQESNPTGDNSSKPGESNPPAVSSKPAESSIPDIDTDDDGNTPNDIMKEILSGSSVSTKEHQKLEELPTSSTLIGSGTLPATKDFSSVTNVSGSVAVTYMQFTNAVARYIKNKDASNTWDPAADYESCYSPKFTYQYDGGVLNPLWTLMEVGATTIGKDAFAVNKAKVSVLKDKNGYLTASTGWTLGSDLAKDLFNYRLSGYSAATLYTDKYEDNLVTLDGYYDMTSVDIPLYNCFTEDKETGEKTQKTFRSEIGVSITTSENGKKLLKTMKDAIATGNVVIAHSYRNNLVDTSLLANTGDLGKAGDTVYLYAYNYRGNDKVTKESIYFSIVGYDDNYTVVANGVTMKGAFQICDNTEEVKWIMYDAFNSCSEYEEFAIDEIDGLADGAFKEWAVDAIYMTYWDTDIVEGVPELYAEIELETTNRYAFDIYLSRSNARGEVSTMNTYITAYSNKYDFETNSLDYFNPEGVLNGPAVNAVYTVSFERLLLGLSAGTTYKDYDWGIHISSSTYNFPNEAGKSVVVENPVILKKIVIKNKNGEAVATMNWNDGLTINKETRYFAFNFGSDELATSNLKSGSSYMFENVATGTYLLNGKTTDCGPMGILGGALHSQHTSTTACTCYFKVTYSSKDNVYKFTRSDDKYVIDVNLSNDKVQNGYYLTSGIEAMMKPKDTSRSTSTWKISYNDDGTITIFLTTKRGTNYALGIVDGIVRLVKATELTDNIKWIAHNYYSDASTLRMNTTVTKTESGVTVTGTPNSATTKKVTVVVRNADTGEEVAKQEEVAVTNGKFEASFELGKGNYYVEFSDSKGALKYAYERYFVIE